MEVKIKQNFGKLKKLVKAMAKQYSVKVGILADKGGTDTIGENLDLAGLGAIQEFGCTINVTPKMRAYLRHHGLYLKKTTTQITIPARSFLEMPLSDWRKIKAKLKEHLGDEEIIVDYVMQTGDFASLATMLGASAVEVIHDAFASGGFGQWAENHWFTIQEKGSALPLTGKGRGNESSGHLGNSITYEVDER